MQAASSREEPMTKRLTRPSALAAVSCLALSVFAFSPAFAEGLKIGFSQVTLQSPFYVQLKDGAEAAATARAGIEEARARIGLRLAHD